MPARRRVACAPADRRVSAVSTIWWSPRCRIGADEAARCGAVLVAAGGCSARKERLTILTRARRPGASVWNAAIDEPRAAQPPATLALISPARAQAAMRSRWKIFGFLRERSARTTGSTRRRGARRGRSTCAASCRFVPGDEAARPDAGGDVRRVGRLAIRSSRGSCVCFLVSCWGRARARSRRETRRRSHLNVCTLWSARNLWA